MEKVRIGLIGFGYWANDAYLPSLRALPGRAEVVAVSAPSEATRAKASACLGPGVRTFADYHDLLAQDAVDAVMVAVPNALHAEVALEAMAWGKHLFLEPPVGMRPEEVESVLDAAAEAKGIVAFDFELRTMPVCAALQRIVRSGELGRPLSASVELSANWGYGGGSFGEPTALDGFYPWVAVWYLDVLDVLLDGPEPIRAQVAGGRAMNGPMLDHGHALIEYCGGGVGRFSHTIISADPEVRVGATLLCERGELTADLQAGTLRCRPAEGSPREEQHPPRQPVYGWAGLRDSIEAFLDAIVKGSPVPGDVGVARRDHQALFACHWADQAALLTS